MGANLSPPLRGAGATEPSISFFTLLLLSMRCQRSRETNRKESGAEDEEAVGAKKGESRCARGGLVGGGAAIRAEPERNDG